MDAKDQAVLDSMGEPMSMAQEKKLFRGMFYGDFGSGKTDLTAKIIQECELTAAMFTTDSAWTTVLKYPDAADRITRYNFDGLKQVRLIAQAHDEGIKPYSNFDTIVLDTISTACDLVLSDLVEQKKFNDQKDPRIQGWTHYGLLKLSLVKTIDQLRASGLHVIYTTHLREPSDEDRKKKQFAIRPSLPEASFKELAKESQVIGWLHKEQKGGQRKIQFEGTTYETAKSQLPTIQETTYNVDEIPGLIKKFLQ